MEDSELLQEFVLEAKAHIADIETGLLELEQGIADEDLVHAMFRAAHSIKGTASFFQLNKIVDLAHGMENVFGELRDGRQKSSRTLINALLNAADVLKELLNMPKESGEADIAAELSALTALMPGRLETNKPAVSAWDIWNELTEAEDKQTAETQLQASPSVSLKPAEALKEKKVSTSDSVRVNVSLLNDLLTIAGEMVLRRNQLLRIADTNGKEVQYLESVTHSIDELTTKLQKKVMQTRMQPIAHVFNKFPRLVRDLSCKVGKEVELKLEGLNVELDRSLIEALADPLTHLVRNALDHGIETPVIRQELNKPVSGSLLMKAYQESGRVIVKISDDGSGIDLEKVKQSALRKGLITLSELTFLDEADVYNFIMQPGFSTADKVTDISGRGVGLDVVKNNIEKLGGKIELYSMPGEGTTFRLQLPLTLAIIPAVIVIDSGQSFVIPQSNIKELLLVQPDEMRGVRLEEVNKHPMLRLRGQLLPLIRLGEVLEETKARQELYEVCNVARQMLRIVVIKAGEKEYGLVVDAVYDAEEILVKPNGEEVNSCGLYSGATVLGDGSIAMIIDTESPLITERLFFYHTPSAAKAGEPRNISADKQFLLLFKCSCDEMLGLDLAMVSRVEKVALSKLKKIGAKYYFVYQGRTIRLIRPEHYLPIKRKKVLSDTVVVILPRHVNYPVGILADTVYDTIFTSVALESQGVTGKGIIGSAIINDNLVTLLNMHELFGEAIPEYHSVPFASMQNSRTAKTQKILLAEDTPFFLQVIKSYLEVAGYEVLTAVDGREAWEKLQNNEVNMVVSDIEMPRMTGIDLVRAIRSDDKLRSLPVIALTSLTGENNKEKGLRAGFDRYEYKLDRMRLLGCIQEFFTRPEMLKEVTT